MNIKYKFVLEEELDNDPCCYSPGREIVHVHTGELTLSDQLERFEEWLRGVGYIFDGHLEIIEDMNDSCGGTGCCGSCKGHGNEKDI